MNSAPSQSLLTMDDPSPVCITNPDGASPFLLICDHAGNRVPSRLGSLGLDAQEMTRHIAWDIGIADLGAGLAERLDATFISQRYSRLVIDCNREPGAQDAIPEASDGTHVPANQGLDGVGRMQRIEAIHTPYHAAIDAELRRRDREERETVLIALHSFTPSMQGVDRPWQIGLLYGGGDEGFARAMLRILAARGDLIVGDNQPYAMDGIDFTVPTHAFPSARAYVEIEIRQDLLSSARQVDEWVSILESSLVASRSEIRP